VSPTGAALGAEARGIDLRVIDDAALRPSIAAWLDHQVLLIRDQRLSDQDLITFSRRFGRARSGADPGERPALRRRMS